MRYPARMLKRGGTSKAMTPFINPETRKVFIRDYERRLYQTSQAHRDAEAKRKAAWYAEKASDPAWLAMMAERKRELRAGKKKS